MKIPPGGIPTPEIPTHQTPHGKPPPPLEECYPENSHLEYSHPFH